MDAEYKCFCSWDTTVLYVLAATEIQNIQIAEGDICRNLPLPIYMIFPRLFTCPTLATNNFKVGESISSQVHSGHLPNG